MERPWLPDRAVPPALARERIEACFPDLRPAEPEPFGLGWDNTAYLVRGVWVFRFPRRELAVPLLERENALLPALAPHLPLAVPVPERVGARHESFPWPFAGYRRLPGTTADRAGLRDADRLAAAPELARFLRALHGFPVEEAKALGAGPDLFGKTDVDALLARFDERVEQAVLLGLLASSGAARERIRALAEPARAVPRLTALVHGDLYSRHLLFDERRALCGVIDWGDVHLGHPAVDLAVAYSWLAPGEREGFFAEYGDVDAATHCLARLRALFHSLAVLLYAVDVDDRPLVAEAAACFRRAGR